MRHQFCRPALPLILSLLSVGAAHGAQPAELAGDVDAGHALARAWCHSCHIVEQSSFGISNGAPPFAAVARLPSTTSLSLRVFLQTSHKPMPDLQMSNEQIADVTAYILSLRQK